MWIAHHMHIMRMTTSSKTTGWTLERTDLAKALWAEGQSATQIALRLGVSRCAVLSKIHREKEDAWRRAPADPRAPPGVERLGPARRDVNRSVVRRRKDLDLWRPPIAMGGDPVRAEAPPQADAAAFAPLPGTTPRPWISRSRDECAWPVDAGEAEMQYACCAPAVSRQPYCEAHRRWAYAPAEGRTAADLAREVDALVAWLTWRGA
jgi:GcrA cell cycle regulator